MSDSVLMGDREEEAWVRHSLERERSQTRLFIGLATALIPAWIPFDFLLEPAAAPHILWIRLVDVAAGLEGGATRILGGTGLGLAITKELVSLHGGRIEVREAEEDGASFRVTVPVHAPPEARVGIEGGGPREAPTTASRELTRLAVAALEEEAVQLSVDERPTGESAAISCDAARVRQVVGHLLDQAIKQTDRAVPICARARRVGDVLHVAVHGDVAPTSDAPGRAPSGSERSGARRRRLSLGLTLARDLIEALGGRLTIADRPEGGAGFGFSLPLAADLGGR